MLNARFLKIYLSILLTLFTSFSPKILKGFNLNRRSAKLITPNELKISEAKLGGEESACNRNHEMVQYQQIKKTLSPFKSLR
jgi:hypothetical protein